MSGKKRGRLLRIMRVACLVLVHPGPLTGQAHGMVEITQPGQQAGADYTDRLIVKLRTQAAGAQQTLMSAAQVRALSTVAGVPLSGLRPMSGGAHVLKLPSRMAVAAATAIAQRLGADPNVLYAEPDRIMHPMLVPSDPLYASQWHYKEPATE